MTGKDILELDDRQYEDVEVPEWHRAIRIRSLSLGDRLRVEALTPAGASGDVWLLFQTTVVQLSATNGDGNLLFTADDVPALADKNPLAINRIFWAAIRINKMRAEDVEELQRNFTKAP